MALKCKFILLLFLCFFTSCVLRYPLGEIIQGDDKLQWSSSDPLTIPYHVRLERFKKGNLVENSSFEYGKSIKGKEGMTFLLEGWEKVGRNVEWVNTEIETYHREESRSGKHAIKIKRKKAGEMDEAEGITSDYIPVIPGNYYFTYDVKLKNIRNVKNRLGVQLYDAITIRVLFYDQNRKLLDAGYQNPLRGTLIDNSDKSYSFSNYWTIDEFPWGTVRGRTFHYPYSEGDVPDKTRYVRLSFGLKGTGTMWIDNIVFRYSKWNFTAMESLKPYFNKTLTLEESIIPTPKVITPINDITYFDIEKKYPAFPIIVLPASPAPAERMAARILKEKLLETFKNVSPSRQLNSRQVRVMETDFDYNEILSSRLVFSIGTNKLYQELRPDLSFDSIRNKDQAYVIKGEQVDNSHIVFLIGNTAIGNYYAATTAVQLLENNVFVYHNAEVIDYPDFLGRSYRLHNWNTDEQLHNDLNSMVRMSLDKLNTAYAGLGRKSKDRIWFDPDESTRRRIKKTGKLFRKSGVMNLAVMFNPYSHLGFEPSAEKLEHDVKHAWTHSDPESFENLKSVFRVGLDAGATTIMLHSDDSVPHFGRNRKHYSLYTSEDKKRFINLQNAHAYIINKLKKWTDRKYPGTRFEFCPPWYTNDYIDLSDGRAEVYFKELVYQIPKDIVIVWTGPTVRSLSIDMADLRRYQLVIGRWPMLWDNTLYARNIEAKRYGGYATYYPGKVRMSNLFEAYDNYTPKDFHKYNDGAHMYINGTAYSEIYKIKYSTVADYLWNTAAYDPEISLWKSLSRTYGKTNAINILYFNDAYYGLYDMFLRMKFEGIKQEYVKTGKTFLDELERFLVMISNALTQDHKLTKELTEYRNRLRLKFEKLVRETDGFMNIPP